MDRLLDGARFGPLYLRQFAIADMVADAIRGGSDVVGHYRVHAFVVMPKHVHLLATPAVALSRLTKSLKGLTGRRANAMLARTGTPFWQEESYDHQVRNDQEFEQIRCYIEGNPVQAGLVTDLEEYRWSSAGSPR
jgi:REP element-mobilizing transposase RayT